MTSNCDDTTGSGTGGAPITLADTATKSLGLRDALGLWGNPGFSLMLPVAAVDVVLPRRPLAVAVLLTIAVGLPGVFPRRGQRV